MVEKHNPHGDTKLTRTMQNSGFVIAVGDQLAAKSGGKYEAPLTHDITQARLFATRAGAEKTLARLKRDGAYGHKFASASVEPAVVVLTIG